MVSASCFHLPDWRYVVTDHTRSVGTAQRLLITPVKWTLISLAASQGGNVLNCLTVRLVMFCSSSNVMATRCFLYSAETWLLLQIKSSMSSCLNWWLCPLQDNLSDAMWVIFETLEVLMLLCEKPDVQVSSSRPEFISPCMIGAMQNCTHNYSSAVKLNFTWRSMFSDMWRQQCFPAFKLARLHAGAEQSFNCHPCFVVVSYSTPNSPWKKKSVNPSYLWDMRADFVT